MDYEKILAEDNKLEENSESEKTQETLEETCHLDYGYVLNENSRFTERCRLNELAVESFVAVVKKVGIPFAPSATLNIA